MKTTEELKNLLYKNETVADAAPDAIAAAQDFCEGYKTFLDNAKTEREATAYSEKLLTARPSMSALSMPAAAMARCEAARARSLVFSCSAAICRALMPVRATIHSSLVSMRSAISALLNTFSGR